MKYVIIADRLLEALWMKWQDANVRKIATLEYYIANINPQDLLPIQGKNAITYPIVSHYPHGSWLSECLNNLSKLLRQVRCGVTSLVISNPHS